MKVTQASLEASRASMKGVTDSLKAGTMAERAARVNRQLKSQGFSNIGVAPYHDKEHGDVYGIYILTGEGKKLVRTVRQPDQVFSYLKEQGITG